MKVRHHDLEVELPDEWWVAAGMSNFAPLSSAYRCDHISAGLRIPVMWATDSVRCGPESERSDAGWFLPYLGGPHESRKG